MGIYALLNGNEMLTGRSGDASGTDASLIGSALSSGARNGSEKKSKRLLTGGGETNNSPLLTNGDQVFAKD